MSERYPNYAEWLGFMDVDRDLQVGDRRVVFIDGFGGLDATVVAFDDEMVTIHPDGWESPIRLAYDVLGVKLETAQRWDKEEAMEGGDE